MSSEYLALVNTVYISITLSSDWWYWCPDSAEEEDNGSCDSEDGVGNIKISSSSKDSSSNQTGTVSFSSLSSKFQANQKAQSERPAPQGELSQSASMFI